MKASVKVVRLISLVCFAVGLLTGAHAIKTGEVEIGNSGVYDGTVTIIRTGSGEMEFKDNITSQSVTLSDIAAGKNDHGPLIGLGDDDHLQYINTVRHNQSHTSAYNDSLAIGVDANNNITVGSHMTDSNIHIHRDGDENVEGDWLFNGTPEFRNDVTFSNAGSLGDQFIYFLDVTPLPYIKWDDLDNEFEINKALKGVSLDFDSGTLGEMYVNDILDGNASGVMQNFGNIEGISPADLLDKSVDEDVSGQWDFYDKTRVFRSLTSNGSDQALSGGLFSFVDTITTDGDLINLERVGLEVSTAFHNTNTGTVSASENVGITGKSTSSSVTGDGDEINNFGVIGKSASDSLKGNVVGVAGFADYGGVNRARIGVYGGLDSSIEKSVTSFPLGEYAGYFEGVTGMMGDTYTTGSANFYGSCEVFDPAETPFPIERVRLEADVANDMFGLTIQPDGNVSYALKNTTIFAGDRATRFMYTDDTQISHWDFGRGGFDSAHPYIRLSRTGDNEIYSAYDSLVLRCHWNKPAIRLRYDDPFSIDFYQQSTYNSGNVDLRIFSGMGSGPYLGLTHDGTDGVISVSSGEVKIDDVCHVTGALNVDGATVISNTLSVNNDTVLSKSLAVGDSLNKKWIPIPTSLWASDEAVFNENYNYFATGTTDDYLCVPLPRELAGSKITGVRLRCTGPTNFSAQWQMYRRRYDSVSQNTTGLPSKSYSGTLLANDTYLDWTAGTEVTIDGDYEYWIRITAAYADIYNCWIQVYNRTY